MTRPAVVKREPSPRHSTSVHRTKPQLRSARPTKRRRLLAAGSESKVKDELRAAASATAAVVKAEAKDERVTIESYRAALKDPAPLPQRNASGALVFKDCPQFRPNLTPDEVLRRGSFGGTYWRPISSAVTGQCYEGEWRELPEAWFHGLPHRYFTLAWDQYDVTINRYYVKSGGDLEMWEGKGWITEQDPYGWFQWYCRYYLGRRSPDDSRQIKRWLGVTGQRGRFRNMLIKKCAVQGKAFNDVSVSPVIRQTLQHWAYCLSQVDADEFVRQRGLPELPRPACTAAGH